MIAGGEPSNFAIERWKFLLAVTVAAVSGAVPFAYRSLLEQRQFADPRPTTLRS